ncbi:hypothetical protein J6S88_04870 [bacterium]|nr:hypothetical protein [bacterium]
MKVSAISNYQNIYRANRNNNQPQPAPIPVEPKEPELNFGHVNTRTVRNLFFAALGALGLSFLASCGKGCGCDGPVIATSESGVNFYLINSCGDTIAHHTDTVTPVNPPVNPHTTYIDDSVLDSIFSQVLGTGENGSSSWEGPSNITGHIKMADWALQQLMEADVDTVRYNSNDTIAYNAALNGRIYDINNVPVGNGNFSQVIQKVNLNPGQVYPGSNAKFGAVITNPLDNKKYLYVPNNTKDAIYVFEYDDGKAKAVKVNPTVENGYSSKPVSSEMLQRDIPENCLVYFKNYDGEVYIYARSASNGEFFVKSAMYEMTNKAGKKED